MSENWSIKKWRIKQTINLQHDLKDSIAGDINKHKHKLMQFS